jgi:hypothetical protein
MNSNVWNFSEVDTPRPRPTEPMEEVEPGFLIPTLVVVPPTIPPALVVPTKPTFAQTTLSSNLSKEVVDYLQTISTLITLTTSGGNKKQTEDDDSADLFDLDNDDECCRTTSTMKIRPFSDVYTSVHLVNLLEQSCETIALPNYGPTKQLYLTSSDDYTHAIIFGYAMPTLVPEITPEKVIGMAHYSWHDAAPSTAFLKYAQKHIGLYYVGESLGNIKPFVRHVCHPLLTLSTTYLMDDNQKNPFAKTRLLSIHVSAKSFQNKTYGAVYCKRLVRRILATNLPIDIYGTGTIPDDLYLCEEESRIFQPNKPCRDDVRIRGPVADMSAMLDPYMYHICIESCVSQCYYSGGPINALLRRANVVYFGSTALVEQYPSGIIPLTGNLDEDIELLRGVAADPLQYYMPICSEYITHIKNTENLVKHLPQYFHDALSRCTA